MQFFFQFRWLPLSIQILHKHHQSIQDYSELKVKAKKIFFLKDVQNYDSTRGSVQIVAFLWIKRDRTGPGDISD